MLTPVDIERYWRIGHNPYTRCGMALEDAMVYRDEVRVALGRLSVQERHVMQYLAAGYAAHEMGISRRTVCRVVRRLRQRNDVMLPQGTRGLGKKARGQ